MKTFSFPMACLLALCLATTALAAEFSANIVAVTRGVSHQGKIWVKGRLVRADLNNRPGVLILRPDRKSLLMILSRPAYYFRLPLKNLPRNLNAFAAPLPGETRRKRLATVKIDGRVLDKFRVVTVNKGKRLNFHIWVDRKLKLPIKIATTDGRYSMALSEIKPGPQPKSLFSPPPGHQKVDVANLPGFDWLTEKKKK